MSLEEYFEEGREIARNKPEHKSGLEWSPKISPLEGIQISKIESGMKGFPQNELMSQKVIPDMASSCIIVGGTGSGKTNLLVNLMLNKDFYRDYFDSEEIYLFSANGKTDDLLMTMGLHDDRIITKNHIKELGALIKRLNKRCEDEGKYDCKRACIIFEDLTSIKKLQDSEEFIKLFTENRHHAAMVFAMVHKYKGLNRTCRLQGHNFIIFPCQNSDLKQISEDHCPPLLDNKVFMKFISEGFKKDKEDSKPFFHINKKDTNDRTKFRRNFDIYLDPYQFNDFTSIKNKRK